MNACDQLVQWMEAFGEPLVLSILRGMGLQEADALDQAQAAWLRALEYGDLRGGFESIDRPTNWLARLARNAGRDFYRARAQNRRRFGEADDIGALGLADRSEDVFERAACDEVLAVFFRTAPEQVSAAFWLVRWAGWTETEAAERLGVSVRTIRRYTAAARARLCRLMGLSDPVRRSQPCGVE